MSQRRIYSIAIIAAFVLSIVLGVLSRSYNYLVVVALEQASIDQIPNPTYAFVLLLQVLVNPLLFFVSFFIIGRKVETIKQFYYCLLSLFAGNAIGLTVGSTIMSILTSTALHNSTALHTDSVIAVVAMTVGTLLGSLISHSFFVGFSALAFSYIIKRNQKPSELA